jgi:4-amino-4-deoxy-L-arabinose transferase-like glycosyltransferase
MLTLTEEDPRASRRRGLLVLVDQATGSHARAVALLLAVALLAFLPGFFQIPPIDRDEARFAQATKQMLEARDYVDIRFQDESRYKKPVGIYWMQAAVVKAASAVGVPEARTTIWLYRIPSLIGAVGAVLLTYWTALAFVSRRAAVLAGLILSASILLGAEARLAKTDAMLLMTIVAAMGALGRVYLGEHGAHGEAFHGWRLPAIFWTAIAGGVLIKGPLILMIVGLPIVVLSIYDRSARWVLPLKPLAGAAWALVLVLPWFVAILAKSGADFFIESIGRDLLAKVATGQESHGAPPGFYFLLYWITFWPGSSLTLLALPAVWAVRREPGARFLLAWIVPAWIVFEIVITKLPHYVLPLYPPIAILIAGVINHHALARGPWMQRLLSGWFLFAALTTIGLIVGMIVYGRQLGLLAWPFATGATIFGLLAWWLFDEDGAERSLLRAVTASILLAFAAYGVAIPTLTVLFPSAMIAESLRGAGCERPQLAAAGYHEPSLVFLAGTSTALVVDGAAGADFLKQGGCRFAAIESRQERSFALRAEALGLRYSLLQSIDAINFNGGRKITISIYQAEREP